MSTPSVQFKESLKSLIAASDRRQGKLKGKETENPKDKVETGEEGLTNKQVKRKRQEEAEKNAEERSRRKWEVNYCSEDSKLAEETFTVYYCAYCGAFALTLISKRLEQLPKRKTDNSRVLSEQQSEAFQKSMARGQTTIIKREKGLERQYRLNCKDCGLFICYRPVPWTQPCKYTYIVKDSLVDDPSKVKRLEEKEEETVYDEHTEVKIIGKGNVEIQKPPPATYVEKWDQSRRYKCMQVDIGREPSTRVRLFVTVTSDKKITKISGIGETVLIDLAAPATEGVSNNKLVHFLAKIMGMDSWADLLDKRQIFVYQGQQSRSKVVQIEGFTPDVIMNKLNKTQAEAD